MANGNENVKNHRLMSLNPNMNHGHLHANKIAEIMNNAIGNPTCLKELPHPILDNDKMHLIDYHLVSCFKASKLIFIISHFRYERQTIEIVKFETCPYISWYYILHAHKNYLPIWRCNYTATNLSPLLFLLFTTNQTKTKSDWTIEVLPQIENPNDKTIYYAELFPNIEEGETNPWISHHEKFNKIFNLSAYNPKNHKTIAEHYDCLGMYESLIKKNKMIQKVGWFCTVFSIMQFGKGKMHRFRTVRLPLLQRRQTRAITA